MTSSKIRLAAAIAVGMALTGCNQGTETADGNASATAASEDRNIGAALAANDDLSGTSDLVRAAKLDTVLTGPGPYTVFAPSNAALGELPDDVVTAMKQEQARAQLTDMLTGHIVPGTITAADLTAAVEKGDGKTQIKTMAGDMLTVTRAGGSLMVAAPGGTPVKIGNRASTANNGIIHMIEGVLTRSYEKASA